MMRALLLVIQSGVQVNEEEAKTVRLIYELFLEGHTPFSIAKELTKQGIKTPMGKDKWVQSTVQSILQNEKYRSDALLQKTFTVDFLSKKHKKNEGEVPQYYVEGSHEAIVSPHIFEIVQAEMKRRLSSNSKYSGVNIFSSKICCGECGGWYGAKVWHSNDKYRRVVYQCNNKYKNKSGNPCRTPHLTEAQIREMFIKAVNELITEKDELIGNLRMTLSVICDNTELEKEQRELEEEMTVVAELTEKCVEENAHVALDQEEYRKRYNGLVARYDKAKANYEAVSDKIRGNMARQLELERFIEILAEQEPVTEFDGALWAILVDHVTVNKPDDIAVVFRDGTEIKEYIGTK
ncbi:recombinase family protein [Luxibacter massiliensis]|uniref:recombinase family protein n=1 Tax=Luxibacter massiliensis TaxID=2219695 RepID=UPI0027B916E7|nr:recombinase family protein [Luxibacter massiliensis]